MQLPRFARFESSECGRGKVQNHPSALSLVGEVQKSDPQRSFPVRVVDERRAFETKLSSAKKSVFFALKFLRDHGFGPRSRGGRLEDLRNVNEKKWGVATQKFPARKTLTNDGTTKPGFAWP